MIKRIFLLLFLISISWNVYSKIQLSVEIVFQKGIDRGLVLTSEYHSLEEVNNYGMTRLKMKNDLEILLSASFFDNDMFYGPSNLIKIDGQLYLRGQRVKDSFFNSEILIDIGEKRTLIYINPVGDQVELSITPEIR